MRLPIVLLFLVACGGDGGSGDPAMPNGSCDTRMQNSVCIEYSGPQSVVDVYKNNCAPGTWSTGACPTTNRVGGCRLSDAGLKLTYTQQLYSPAFSTSTAMQGCVGGMFVP
ncbi:MAG: hypothetical protein JNJ46_07010 [Myxococcales bacterium]|nr:hypothetical protein [Myxococcales bacterium]